MFRLSGITEAWPKKKRAASSKRRPLRFRFCPARAEAQNLGRTCREADVTRTWPRCTCSFAARELAAHVGDVGHAVPRVEGPVVARLTARVDLENGVMKGKEGGEINTELGNLLDVVCSPRVRRIVLRTRGAQTNKLNPPRPL